LSCLTSGHKNINECQWPKGLDYHQAHYQIFNCVRSCTGQLWKASSPVNKHITPRKILLWFIVKLFKGLVVWVSTNYLFLCASISWSPLPNWEPSKRKAYLTRWLIIDIPIPQQWPTTLKKEDQGTPKGTNRMPFEKKKPSLNPQREKQLTIGRMGKMTHSSALSIPAPEVSSWLQSPLFSSHSAVSPASQHTQELSAPCSLQLHDLVPSPWNTRETGTPV
jgi:hypothetical protein